MDISNKTLALVLVAAIAVSVFGTIFSINRMNQLSSLKTSTGFATSSQGNATVYINTTTSIRFSTTSIDWGTGAINSTVGAPLNCTLNSETGLSTGCVGFTPNNVGLILENDGNTIPTIRLAADANATTFIGGDTQAGGPQFQYRVTTSEANSCASPLPATYTDVNTTNPGTVICPALDYNDANDTLRINIQINLPYTAPQGQKIAVLTATAS